MDTRARRWWPALVALVLSGSAWTPAAAQQAELAEWLERTRLSGLLFGDFYWFARDHADEVEGQNGFWFRRIYLTLDSDLNRRVAFRLRLEMNSPGDFESAAKLDPFVKDAWVRLEWERHDLYLGLSSTPTWNVSESVWGYRFVEKTPLDLFRLGSSRDFGVALKGRLDAAGKVRYHAMLGNGSGTRGETNQGKKGFLSLTLYPVEGLLLQGYADFEQRPENVDRETLQLFAAWEGEKLRAGVLGARQYRDPGAGEIETIDLLSLFGVWKASDHVSLLGRFDRLFDPLPDGPTISYLPLDPSARVSFLLAGIDFTVWEKLHLIPNVETIFYDAVGDAEAPETDVVLRTTFYLRF